MSRLDFHNKGAIVFPLEMAKHQDINIDLTKLSNANILKYFKNVNIHLDDIDCILSFNNDKNSGFGAIIANLFNKEYILVNTDTGFNSLGSIKYNYNKKYCIWIDTLKYNKLIFNGFEKLKKRGLSIIKLLSFVNFNEGVDKLFDLIYPNVKIETIYNINDLFNYYKSKNIISSFFLEKYKGYIDKNYKLTNQYINIINIYKNNNHEYIKKPYEWYIKNYYTFNNPFNKYNKLMLHFLQKNNWTNVKNEIIKYGKYINIIYIYPKNIDNLNNLQLYKLQCKYNFNIIEYNPYNTLLEMRNSILNNNILNNIETIYDGFNLNLTLDLNKDTDQLINDLKILITLTNKKIILYVNILNNKCYEFLQDIIIYANYSGKSAIQGIIFDYNNISIPKYEPYSKYNLNKLVPIILSTDTLNNDVKNFYNKHKFTYLLISPNILNREQTNLQFLINYYSINNFKKLITNELKNIKNNDEQEYQTIRNNILSYKYSLSEFKDNKEYNNKYFSFINYLSSIIF